MTLARHDEAPSRRFEKTVLEMPEIISADHVTGGTYVLLWVVARDVA